ncbi:hypothetical protein F0Z19_0713 [Vibrio cyclitrophicus]|nr:hypothetical protein F0Z19_0713 [Vibrio cyclitrophicus]
MAARQVWKLWAESPRKAFKAGKNAIQKVNIHIFIKQKHNSIQ